MNKVELIASVAEKAGLSKKDAEKAIAAVVASVEEALVKGDKVQLIGFGTFRFVSVLPAWAATPRPKRRSRSPLPSSPCSRPAPL